MSVIGCLILSVTLQIREKEGRSIDSSRENWIWFTCVFLSSFSLMDVILYGRVLIFVASFPFTFQATVR